MRTLFALTLLLSGLLTPTSASAQTCDTFSGLPVPRFVSLKFNETRGRAGPSFTHPVAWLYQRQGLPVEIVAETPDWRRVRDPGGEVTWMHRSILSGRRSVYTLEDTPLHARDNAESPVEAVAEPGVVLALERCRTGWCRVEAQGYRGWVQTQTLWGVYPEERDTDETGAAGGDGNPALSASRAHDTALP